MRILAVDDDPVARRLIETALAKLGHDVVLASGGESAWSRFLADPTEAIVSDWLMPGVDGLELCRRIRQWQGPHYVYFMLLTGVSDDEDNLERAAEAGVDDFLIKPVQNRELWRRLRVAQRILQFTVQVQKLEGYLPICSYCKKIRDDKQYWQQVENYVSERTSAKFSHSICPDCYDTVLVPQMEAMGIKPPPHTDRAEGPGTSD